MSEDLYQEIILDHYKNPRGIGLNVTSRGQSHQVNPTCGDEVTVDVGLNADGTLQVAYTGQGCSISQASASVMSELINGKTPDQAAPIQAAFMELMRSKGQSEPDEELLEDGVAFIGVSKFPARIKCALISWMALADSQIKAQLTTEMR
ncbi:SUF system NifU family Fe-S cluster assembly protein [Actinomycetota bacterium]|nr:SUF system NifU family Fe-S cluster assembly protein [Actinomycetota bacterium]